jgi:hypothetical protein
MEIIDAEWQALGVSDEELRLDERLAEVFARRVASGQDVDQLFARWGSLTPEQILAEVDTPEINSPCKEPAELSASCS